MWIGVITMAQVGPILDAGEKVLDARLSQVVGLIAVGLVVVFGLGMFAYIRDQSAKARRDTQSEKLLANNEQLARQFERGNKLAYANKKLLEERNQQARSNEERFLKLHEESTSNQQMLIVLLRAMDARQSEQVSEVQRLDRRITESDQKAEDGRREAVEQLEQNMKEELIPIERRLTAIENEQHEIKAMLSQILTLLTPPSPSDSGPEPAKPADDAPR